MFLGFRDLCLWISITNSCQFCFLEKSYKLLQFSRNIFTIFQNFLYNKNILFSTFFLGCHFQELFTCLFQILAKFSLIFEISDPRLALSLLKSLPRFWLVLGQPFYLEKPELWPYDLCWEITLDAPRPYFKLEPLWIGARDNIFRSSFPMDGRLFSGFKELHFLLLKHE